MPKNTKVDKKSKKDSKPVENKKDQKKTKKVETSSDSDDSPVEVKPTKKDTKKVVKKDSSSEDSSAASSSDEKPKKNQKDSSDDSSDDSEKVVEAPKKAQKRERPAAYDEPPAKKSKNATVFIGNLPFSATDDMIYSFFSENGIEIAGVRLAKDNNTGNFKGFGHVDLNSEEDLTKALELAGFDLGGREVKIDTANSATKTNGGEASKTIYVGNLSFDVDEDSLKLFLEENGCDKISEVRIIKDENGSSKGYGYTEFEDIAAATVATGLHGLEFAGRNLRINYDTQKPGGSFGGGRGGGRGFGGGRGGDRGFGGGRGRGGDRGFGGGRGRGGDRGFGGGRGGGRGGDRGFGGGRGGGRGGDRGFGGGRGGDRGFGGRGRGSTPGFQGKKVVFD